MNKSKKKYNKYACEIKKLKWKLNFLYGDYERIHPRNTEKIYKITDKTLKRIHNVHSKFEDIKTKTEYVKNIKIPFLGFRQFIRAVNEIEEERPIGTNKENIIYYKKELGEVRRYLQIKEPRLPTGILEEKFYGSDERMEEIGENWIGVNAYQRLEKYLTNRIDYLKYKRTNMPKNSPWSSGLFYLLLLTILISGFFFLSQKVTFLTFALIVILAILAFVIIGAFQLRNDSVIGDESLTTLVIEALKRLPVINNLFNKK